MLSILIPIYNYNICMLVDDLHHQGLEAKVPFEIICLDDGSSEAFKKANQRIKELEHVRYKELSQNVGRSKIRNQLADTAQFEYLLFMDCDSKVVKSDFLQAYIDRLDPDSLLYGGRSYQKTAPKQNELLLHWTYGSQREVVAATQRQLQAHHSFMTNNFLIPKAIFNRIRFDERLTQYGHEDTLFGLDLRQLEIPIFHFDNPLEHSGIEPNNVFIAKTIKALENLAVLSKSNENIDTRLLSFYRKIRAFRLHYPILILYNVFGSSILKNLKSNNPSLIYFDLFKLAELIKINQRNG